MNSERLKIVFKQEDDGGFSASCPDLPDCEVKAEDYLSALQKLKKLIVKRLQETQKK